jgi:hypothetical protein
MIKTSTQPPKVYEQCRKQFGVSWESGIIMTYGDTVHCKFPLSDDLIVHEAIHVKQQTEMDKDEWWDKYFNDKKFRLSQEVEAYRNQMEYLKLNSSRDYRRMMKKKIIKDMSTIYGGMCTAKEAEALIA